MALEFNTNKCQILRLCPKRDPLNHTYIIHGEELEMVDSLKYLGLTITSDLR